MEQQASTTPVAAADHNRAEDRRASSDRDQTAAGQMTASDVEFTAVRNMYYHDERARWLGTVDRLIAFLTVMFGTSAFGAISSAHPTIASFAAFIATMLAMISLVFRLGERSHQHRDLKRRYGTIMANCSTDHEAAIREILLVNADEPPEMRAVDAMSWNHAARSLKGEDFTPIRLTPIQRALRNVLAFQGAKFPDQS